MRGLCRGTSCPSRIHSSVCNSTQSIVARRLSTQSLVHRTHNGDNGDNRDVPGRSTRGKMNAAWTAVRVARRAVRMVKERISRTTRMVVRTVRRARRARRATSGTKETIDETNSERLPTLLFVRLHLLFTVCVRCVSLAGTPGTSLSASSHALCSSFWAASASGLPRATIGPSP